MVINRLEAEPLIPAKDIAVSVKKGAVTLTGFVYDYFEKYLAEQAAKAVAGIKAVANDIAVKTDGRADPEIARDIVEAFALDAAIPANRITVVVSDGCVTLEGTVDWALERQSAAFRASKVKGVRTVINKILLTDKKASTDVKAKIGAALSRNTKANARRIEVLSDGKTATLSGKVRTRAQRKAAEAAAWAAPGITQVIDNLAISR